MKILQGLLSKESFKETFAFEIALFIIVSSLQDMSEKDIKEHLTQILEQLIVERLYY